mmetsp:Transcript_102555/g.265203  ORF Transcript_102555/g.265203 Transcript_102555/m.265203 type:complete len:230 (-) Transcript_102555:338-1027(-)
MLLTVRPSRAISAAKSLGCGNFRIERSRYSYSVLPEFIVATLPMKGITWVMNFFATAERKVSPEGRENSRMQTRLERLFCSTRFISRKASERSGTLRMPNAIEILSMESLATPALGSESVPSALIPRTDVRSCASPLTRRTPPVRPWPSTLDTPRRSISLLGSTPRTESAGRAPSLSLESVVPASRLTSAVPVARSSTRSPFCSVMHSWIIVLRQYWSNPSDIHLFVES